MTKTKDFQCDYNVGDIRVTEYYETAEDFAVRAFVYSGDNIGGEMYVATEMSTLFSKIRSSIDQKWEADWTDHSQEKWYIVHDHEQQKYVSKKEYSMQNIGQIYMSYMCANHITDMCNEGKITMEITSEYNQA